MPFIAFNDRRTEPNIRGDRTPSLYESKAPLLTGGGSLRSLNASRFMLSPNAGGRLSAPQLRARTIQPMQVKAPQATAPRMTAEVNRNLVGQEIADLGNTAGRVIMQMADADAQRQATDANNQFDARAREVWLGGQDPRSGEFVPGYASTQGRTAVEKYDSFQLSIGNARTEIAATLDDSAKAKFLALSNASYQNLLDQGSQHAALSRGQWEKEQLQQAWIIAYQKVDDKLVIGDMRGASAVLIDTMNRVQASYQTTPSKAMAEMQGRFRGMIDYIGTTDNASAKLIQLKAVLEPTMDLVTSTYLNKTTRTVQRQENEDLARIEARDERMKTARRKAETLTMWKQVDDGQWNQAVWKEKRDAGIINHSDYASAQRRANGLEYLTPHDSLDMVQTRETIVLGMMGPAEIYDLPIPKSERDSYMNLYASTSDKNTRQEYQDANQLFRDALTERGIPKGEGYANRVLTLQIGYDKMRRNGVDHFAAVNQVMSNADLKNDYAADNAIVIPGIGSVVPKDMAELTMYAQQAKRAEAQMTEAQKQRNKLLFEQHRVRLLSQEPQNQEVNQ